MHINKFLKLKKILLFIIVLSLLLVISESLGLLTVYAQDIDCLMCHEPLSKEKVVHAAVQMGCPTCHSAIDAKDIPHKKTNDIAKGLSSDQPDLCYTCHDKSKFTNKTIHAAIGMGCTGCHNPHSSKNDKLLISTPPDLCYNCHDKKMFAKKTQHAALAMGCTSCHNPHSTDTEKLVLSATPDLCYNCHDSAKFTGKTVHPPVMGGMCTSCHNPHSTDTEKLVLSATPDLCYNCHDKTIFTNKRKPHMPVEAGRCFTCHEDHVSNNPSLLAKPIFELCINCHSGQAKGTHVLRGLRGFHPVKEGKDPSREGKEMSCASCHNPHGSDFDKLFVQHGICKRCHKY